MTIRRLTICLPAVALMLGACGEKAKETPAGAATTTAPAAEGTPPAPAAAAKPAEAPSPLPPTAGSKLASYVGKYPFDKVDGVAWNDHALVKAGIAASVRDKAALKAITTLEGPSGPIEMRGDKVMSWACEAHNCGAHQWAVLVDPRTGATDVCYYDEEADAAKSRWFLSTGKEEKRDGNCQ
ncbi:MULTISPECIES: hypothetical protein [unclassified Sphingopyxis]|uniref:hypothetical protein n=1 Tax=unclassified Sphingopyxis TaxID=2614943 RepID=UPI00072FCC01|nr:MULTISPECIES: hypothetical protein [unclassified Sphingopyxis]KTE24691.1 hypothetical protein ATE61_12300 [Sphingopyxis sp. H057]KTE50715.1 hypothetical protein ATE64_15370 [Sphingopyxis sp. H073]KTE51701.1 hypothetical protein ATE69_15310 [Sphingopyxis sp. H071]KTE56552.1 hypothetical protein ATE66_18640 [Sphingopyxis sp. H107]KTE64267.1 hypothetical protein ATE65_12065 [Sphingopyxis sp. H100]